MILFVNFLIYVMCVVGMIAIATAVLMSGTDKAKRFFSASVYLICVWAILQYIVQAFSMAGFVGLILIKIISSIAFIFVSLFYMFIGYYIGKPPKTATKFIFLIGSAIETCLNMSNLLIYSAWGEPSGLVVKNASMLYPVYIAIVGIVSIVALLRLVKGAAEEHSRKTWRKDILLVVAVAQMVFVVVICDILLSDVAVVQLAIPISCLVMSSIIGLAIVKYKIFDVKAATIRAVAYVLSILALSAIYYFIAYAISIIFFKGNIDSSISVSPINIALALLLAFLFQPIKHFFDQLTDDIFYKVSYKVEDFFRRIDKILSSTADLRSMLDRTANEIGQTLKSEQTSFFINLDDEHYITAGTDNYVKIPRYDGAQLSCGQKNGKIIIASLLPDDDPLQKIMLTYRLEIVVPLIQGKEILGCLCLGENLTSGYTGRDVKALNTISNELIIGIRNALAINEVKELNSTLQQRVNNATRELRQKNSQLRQLDKVKDDFVSIASHQLRTPLTGVKGYISMLLEGDAGRITKRQREFLEEAFVSSERMVRLINDFLSLSRLQNGKFVVDRNPHDLIEITRQEVDNLRSNAAARGMELVYKAPNKIPLISIDEEKLRQVIMNFIDNAIYYSQDNSKIYINLDLADEGKSVSLRVRDNGIGVPDEDKAHLFTKFFRADNAKRRRPDGTGVGLYLAKKIVDGHGGKIIFESKENKGSVFGFKLPIENSK